MATNQPSLSELRIGNFPTAEPEDYGVAIRWGIADNADLFRSLMGGVDATLTTLAIRNCGIIPLASPGNLAAAAASFGYILGRSTLVYKTSSVDNRTPLALAELFIPNIPSSHFLKKTEAERELIISTTATMKLSNVRALYTVDNVAYQTAIAPGGPLSRYIATIPAEYPWPPDTVLTHGTADMAYDILAWMATFSTPYLAREVFAWIIYFHCLYARKDTATQYFLTKVAEGVDAEIGVALDLDTTILKRLSRMFCEWLDESIIVSDFRRWHSMIPEHALRLRLTLQKMCMEGLTSIAAICDAFRAFPYFPWATCDQLFPGQLDNIRNALGEINDNPYYGFKRNLGLAAASRYKAVAYVAFQLLILGKGATTFRRYKGMAKSVPHKAAIDDIIKKYLDEKVTATTASPASVAIAADVARLAAASLNITGGN